jgi:hypothetical protein
MSHSTERLYRDSGEEAYDQADKGEPAESQPKEDATAATQTNRFTQRHDVPGRANS